MNHKITEHFVYNSLKVLLFELIVYLSFHMENFPFVLCLGLQMFPRIQKNVTLGQPITKQIEISFLTFFEPKQLTTEICN